jgi:hypothetical protein
MALRAAWTMALQRLDSARALLETPLESLRLLQERR